MPKRLIDDSMLSSPSLARCSPRAQDAWPRFILIADDFGSFEVIPRALVGKGWPKRTDVSEADVIAWLNEYVDAGMACLYTATERRLCYLTGWNGPHGQKKRAEYDPNAPAGTPGRHGSKRRLPAPDPALVAAVVAGARRDADGKAPGTDREDTEGIPSDSVPAREVAGSRSTPAAVPAVPGPVVPVPVPVPDAVAGETVAPSPSGSTPSAAGVLALALSPPPAKPPDLSPVVLVLPCTGTGPREFGVTEAQVAKWHQAFPGVDTLGELRKALVWLEANPTKVKTHRGVPAFCVRWLSHAQDDQRGGARPGAPQRRPGMAAMGSAAAFAKDEKPW